MFFIGPKIHHKLYQNNNGKTKKVSFLHLTCKSEFIPLWRLYINNK